MFSSLRKNSEWTLLLARIVLAAIFLIHGSQKWALWSATPDGMPGGLVLLFKILAIAEPVLAIALLLGIFMEWASLLLCVDMIGAILFKVFMLHIPFAAGNATGWEFDLTIFVTLALLVTFGAGDISLDGMMMPRSKKKK